MINNQKLELTWIGKDIQPKLEPRILIEDPDKSYGDRNTENMLIFGDNLLALKALEQEFTGRIKCIFIDPPYNTGSAFTHYDDGLEHSLWLTMMRDRLVILKRLLSEDGSIWITIDDNEAHYLKVLCDEVFGRGNFISNVIWEKVFASKNSSQYFSTNHDHLFVYAKTSQLWKRNLLPRSSSQETDYKNPDNDPRGLWNSVALSARNYYSLGEWNVTTPSGRFIPGPPKGRYWAVSPDKFKELCSDNRIWWGRKGDGVPRRKTFLSEVQAGMVPSTIWPHGEAGNTQEAKKEVIAAVPSDAEVFATPKPEKLLQRILTVATNHNDLVLDSFGGSGTTGVVAHKMGRKKEENIQQLLTLEDPDNKIEIVIHVNMLKEGWDVTNLYTIIPLRTSASETLTEQTMGRGLRLPYGKRTGHDKVDKLTIIAHDNFQRIIEEANKPGSIIKQKNIIEIDPSSYEGSKEVVVAKSAFEEKVEVEKQKIETMPESKEKAKAVITLEIRKTIYATIPQVNNKVKNVSELSNQDIKDIVVTRVKEQLLSAAQPGLYDGDIHRAIEEVYQATVDEFILNSIEIPRIVIQPTDEVDSGFRDFDLDTKNLNYPPVAEEILIQYLNRKENAQETLIGKYGISADKPENLILNELINFPEIDYDSQSELLQKLVGQAISKFANYLDEEGFINVVKYHKREVANLIYSQMRPHFYCNTKSYEEPTVKPFTQIEGHNLIKIQADSIHHYTDTITPTSAIPLKVFSGFKKACHTLYKFDAKGEKDFATILENDKAVIKWLRPASKQFKIYWDHNARTYEPDFVVETDKIVYLTEIKADNQMIAPEVLEKAKAAVQYCKHATDHNLQNGGKEWKYLLIPHSEVLPNMSLGYLAGKRTFVGEPK